MTTNNLDLELLAVDTNAEHEHEMKSTPEVEGEVYKDVSILMNIVSNITDNSLMSDPMLSNFSSRVPSIDAGIVDIKIKQLEDQNKEYNSSYIHLIEENEALNYQNGLIRDQMDDLNERLRDIQRKSSEKERLCSFQKYQIDQLKNHLKFLKHQLDIRDQLILDNNLLVSDDIDFTDSEITVDNSNKEVNSKIMGTALLPKDLVEQLKKFSEKTLESCIRKLLDQQEAHQDDIQILQRKLSEEKDDFDSLSKIADHKKHHDADYDLLKKNCQDLKSQSQEYKRQSQISQHKVAALEADIIRLEGQVKRYKSIAESAEKQEDELKQEKRKYQREFREAQNKIEDLKSENASLLKKLEKCTKQKMKETN